MSMWSQSESDACALTVSIWGLVALAPLGVWKLVELVAWLAQHVRWA